MSDLNITDSELKTQPEIIIPFNFFSDSYDSILNNIDGLITKTERKMLSFFAFKAYKDGEIFPIQKTIAKKLRIGIRQVKRVIRSLIEKGFLLVTHSSLVERHIYGKGNHYHFLNHEIYGKSCEMSPEMSPEIEIYTFKEKESNKKNKGVSFDPFEFVQRHLKDGKHALSIAEALNSITARMGYIKCPGAYGDKIVEIQSGNYHAADHQQQQEQQQPPTIKQAKTFLEKIGFTPKTIPTFRKNTKNELHQQLRGLKILDF